MKAITAKAIFHQLQAQAGPADAQRLCVHNTTGFDRDIDLTIVDIEYRRFGSWQTMTLDFERYSVAS